MPYSVLGESTLNFGHRPKVTNNGFSKLRRISATTKERSEVSTRMTSNNKSSVKVIRRLVIHLVTSSSRSPSITKHSDYTDEYQNSQDLLNVAQNIYKSNHSFQIGISILNLMRVTAESTDSTVNGFNFVGTKRNHFRKAELPLRRNPTHRCKDCCRIACPSDFELPFGWPKAIPGLFRYLRYCRRGIRMCRSTKLH